MKVPMRLALEGALVAAVAIQGWMLWGRPSGPAAGPGTRHCRPATPGPDKPIQEFWVAVAGPADNVVIAVVLFGWLIISGTFAPLSSLGLAGGSFIERLMLLKVTLVLFNLIPAFPMDGGRVLRSLLALRLEYMRATQIAATIGQGMALLFGIVGLFTNPFLVFIAFFVWIGAAQETSMVQMKTALSGFPVRRAMLTDFQALSPHDLLSHAVRQILTSSQTDFPVVEALDAAHRRITALLAPYRGRTLLVFHPAYGYFTRRYGLEQVAVEVGGKEPTPRQLALLVEQAKAAGAAALFVQPQQRGSSAAAVAEALGFPLVELDPLAPDLIANLERMAREIAATMEGGR